MSVRVHKDGPDLKVQPETPENQEILAAILSHGSPHRLAMFALREHGYGNDTHSVTYPGDRESDEESIPAGKIELHCHGAGTPALLVTRTQYLEVLAAYCIAEGLKEKGNLIREFIAKPGIKRKLREARPELCLRRWQKFMPYLEKRGWKISNDMIRAPGEAMAYHIEYDGDLNVLYEYLKGNLKKNPDARGSWKTVHLEITEALEEFFKAELTQGYTLDNSVS